MIFVGDNLGAKDHLIRVKNPKKKTVWLSDAAWEKLPDEFLIREFSVKGTVYVTTRVNVRTYLKSPWLSCISNADKLK